jgi:flagellar biosynthesis/type III secretory pathway protein FliH
MPPPSPDTPERPPARKRRPRRSASAYQITSHALDTLLKHEAAYLADALSTHFGLRLAPIVAPFPTEFSHLDLHLEQLDSVFLLADGDLLHLEFQATYDRKTLPRFLQYDAVLHLATDRRVRTVVIYGPGVLKAPSELRFSERPYQVRNIFLGRRDGERVYRQVQRTLDQGGALSAGERIDLLFQPLMRQKRRTQPQVFRDALSQAERLPDMDQERAIASLLALAYHVLGEPALNSLVEELMSGNLLVKVLSDERQKGIEQGVQQGIEQGVQRGIEQGIEQGVQRGIEQGIEQGVQRGIEQGIEQGVQQGIEQGIEQGVQQSILRTLRRRFADVPDPVVAQVTRISDQDRLASLLDAAIDASTLDQFIGVLAQ